MKSILCAAVLLLLTACGSPLLPTDQSGLCLFASDEQARNCKAGQLAYFKPTEIRSPQAILNVAAAYCDFNHQVLQNNGGVICVFTRERLALLGQ